MADERIYLEEHCQQKRLHLATKLLNLNQGDTKVAAFYDQCACIWRQLDELGALLGQAEQAQRENNRLRYFFLAHLRPDFDTVCVALMEKLTLTTVEVFTVLQEEEARLCKIISGEQPSMLVLNDNQYQLHAAVMKDGIELAKQVGLHLVFQMYESCMLCYVILQMISSLTKYVHLGYSYFDAALLIIIGTS
jgi:hypothetical protein